MTSISGRTRLLAVIGDPIAHSLSPVMHNAAISALGIDAVYVGLQVSPVSLPHVLRGFEATGIAGNITVPHKLPATAVIIRTTPVAAELGAINTFWMQEGRLIGDNTDVAGARVAAEHLNAPGPWLLAGTGGSARAVAAAARDLGVKLLVRSRDPSRRSDFVEWAQRLGADAQADDDTQIGTAINATPLGLADEDNMPIDLDRIQGAQAALDLVYRPGETAWVRACRGLGMRAADGRAMLVEQGAEAFRRFFEGVEPPREVMKAAVDRSLH